MTHTQTIMKYSLLISCLSLLISCSENELPSCKISQPSDNKIFSTGENISVIVEAEDTDGTINEVEIFIDTTYLESTNQKPYEFSLSTSSLGAGTFTIKAVAKDNELAESDDEIQITIEPLDPDVTTFFASEITNTSITCGGKLIDNGQSQSIQYGICWNIDSLPTINDNYKEIAGESGVFSATIENLDPNTIYYYRAYATNEKGTSYGEQFFVKTYDGTLTDIDGNTYWITTIGEQTWMAENLKVTHFPDGTAIPNVLEDAEWISSTNSEKAYCSYDNDPDNSEIYGLLYNWWAAINDEIPSNDNPSNVQGICPDGWHLPSNSEWIELVIFLGMTPEEAELGYYQGTIGGKLKEVGLTHWDIPNQGATNESGFTALPAGIRDSEGEGFFYKGERAFWWTSTRLRAEEVGDWGLFTQVTSTWQSFTNETYGMSVRCVKD